MALSTEFNTAYDEFVAAWLAHERLAGAGFLERIESKQRLDDLRAVVRGFAAHTIL